MAENIEDTDSINSEKAIGDFDYDASDDDARKEHFTKLNDQGKRLLDFNRQLFSRAKKAEGFEQDKDGKWFKPEQKLEKKPEKKPEALEPKPPSDVDFAQLAFHNTRSDSTKIEHDEDVEFLRETIRETGKPQAYILGSKWFQTELKERQELRATTEATPSGSKRSPTASSQTNPEYWLARGELPPDTPENRKLREDVVNLRYEREKSAFGSPRT